MIHVTEETVRWFLGVLIAAATALTGYFTRRLHLEIERVERRVGELEEKVETESAKTVEGRHALRNEFNAALLHAESRHKDAIASLEVRFNTQIQRVIDLSNTQHAEVKADLRLIQESLRRS